MIKLYLTNSSVVNKAWTPKAKAWTLKAKTKAKAWTHKAKAKAKYCVPSTKGIPDSVLPNQKCGQISE